MNLVRWRNGYCGLGMGFLTATSVWAAPPGILVQNHGALTISLGFLTLSVGVLGFLEVHDALRRKNLPPLSASSPADESVEAEAEITKEEVRQLPGQPSNLLAPPPPPTVAAAPPPPPPPPISVGALSPSPAVSGVPAPPPSGGQDSGSGGWGDLLKRVRSPESGELPPPPKISSGQSSTVTITVPDPGPRPSSGGLGTDEGWDALLKKSSGQNGSPFSSQPGGLGLDPEPGRAGSEGNEEGGLPDFIKKSSRTISLDFTKGGAASNPFQKPPS